jgi:hypothetical protein
MYFIKEKVRTNKRTKLPSVGDDYSKLRVIDNKIYGNQSSNHNYIKCECTCGHIGYHRLDYLRKNKYDGCYECSHTYKDRNYKEVGGLSSRMFGEIRRNANTRNIEFLVDMNYLWNLFLEQNGKCALSNIDLKLTPLFYSKSKSNFRKTNSREEITASLDRIDPYKGYIEGNVQWVHKAINIMKGCLNNSEFINLCKYIDNNNKDYHDNFEPSQLNGYLKRYTLKKARSEKVSKLEGATTNR